VVFAVLNLQDSTTSISVLGVTAAAFGMRVFEYGGDLAVLAVFLDMVGT
jgi:hypothetical protein